MPTPPITEVFFSGWQRRMTSCMIAAVLALAGRATEVRYRIVDLGPLTSGSRINAAGDVVGAASIPGIESTHRAFLYSKGKMTDLGTLGGNLSVAFGLNDGGSIVGVSRIPIPSDSQSAKVRFNHGFIYADGVMHDLSKSPDLEIDSAKDINESGTILCAMHDQANIGLLTAGKLTLLPLSYKSFGPGTVRAATAKRINNAGQVIGSYRSWTFATKEQGSSVNVPDAHDDSHSFLYSGNQVVDLGTCTPQDLNDSGVVVGGKAIGVKREHAFSYANGKMTDLGVPPGFENSEAYGINASGQIVGVAYTWLKDPSGESMKASGFLYSDGQWKKLDDLVDFTGSGLTEIDVAQAINVHGQILASGIGPGGYRSCILTPIKSD